MARDFGGEMRLRLAGGVNATMRGAFTLGSACLSVESSTDQDGSLNRAATPRERAASVTLEDGGLNFDDLLQAERQEIYLTEEITGVSHVFTKAFFSGDPHVDRTTGELTGLMIVAAGYQQLG